MATTILNYEQIIEQARSSWGGKVGDERAESVKNIIDTRLENYHQVTGFSKEDILNAFEKLGVQAVYNFNKETELKINEALKDGWYGKLEEDGKVGLTVLGRDYVVEVNEVEFLPNGTQKINSLVESG